MKQIILLLIFIGLMLSTPYIYKKYIKYRTVQIKITRDYIYKHFNTLYPYLPSLNIMIYNLIHDTDINYWINYCYSQQRQNDKL